MSRLWRPVSLLDMGLLQVSGWLIATGSSATEKCYKGARVTVMRSPTIASARSSALASNRDNGESLDAPHLPDMVQKTCLDYYITKRGAESREDEEVNGMMGRCFESKKQAYEDNCQKAIRGAFAI